MKTLLILTPFAMLGGAIYALPAVADPPAAHHHDMAGMQMMSAAEPLAGASLYQLDARFETAGQATMKLAELRGKPAIVTMFYSSCTSVCPLLTTQLQRLVSSLTAAQQQQLHVLMVSFDSVRDTPAVLTAFKEEHRIDEGNWIIARGSSGDVRTLAAALGIQYRELPDHSFNHSAVITLLDAQGLPRARTQVLADPDPAFLAAVRALLH